MSPGVDFADTLGAVHPIALGSSRDPVTLLSTRFPGHFRRISLFFGQFSRNFPLTQSNPSSRIHSRINRLRPQGSGSISPIRLTKRRKLSKLVAFCHLDSVDLSLTDIDVIVQAEDYAPWGLCRSLLPTAPDSSFPAGIALTRALKSSTLTTCRGVCAIMPSNSKLRRCISPLGLAAILIAISTAVPAQECNQGTEIEVAANNTTINNSCKTGRILNEYGGTMSAGGCIPGGGSC